MITHIAARCHSVYLVVSLTALAACATPALSSDPIPAKTKLQLDAELYCVAKHGNKGLPPKRFTTDGCTLWPDSDWGHCCVTHDIAYWCGGSAAQRADADRELGLCLTRNGDAGMGSIMRLGTRLGGFSILPVPWRWGYGWFWPHSKTGVTD